MQAPCKVTVFFLVVALQQLESDDFAMLFLFSSFLYLALFIALLKRLLFLRFGVTG